MTQQDGEWKLEQRNGVLIPTVQTGIGIVDPAGKGRAFLELGPGQNAGQSPVGRVRARVTAAGTLEVSENGGAYSAIGGTPFVPGDADKVLRVDAMGAATEWSFLEDDNVAPAAAIAGTKIAPDFGAQIVETTNGYISNVGEGWIRLGLIFGSGVGSAAEIGNVRLTATGSVVYRHGNDLTDVYGIGLGNNDEIWIGLSPSGTLPAADLYLSASNAVQLRNGTDPIVEALAAKVVLYKGSLEFDSQAGAPVLSQPGINAIIDGEDFTIAAQGCPLAGGGSSAGAVVLKGGRDLGGFGNFETGIAIHEVPASWNSMERGCFIGDAITAPMANPAAGHYQWSEGGVPWVRTSGGRRGTLIQAYGDMSVTAPAATTLTLQDTPYLMAGTTMGIVTPVGFSVDMAGRITMNAAGTRLLTINAAVSFTCSANLQLIGFMFAYNGTVEPLTEIRRWVGTGMDEGAFALTAMFEMNQSDFLEIFVVNRTSAGKTVTVQKLVATFQTSVL